VSTQSFLVTGASGFVGQTLTREVPGAHFAELPASVDLRDKQALRRAVQASSPNRVIHLAAQTFVPRSFADPTETFSINFQGTWNLLEALDAAKFTGRLLFVSSGDVYGITPENELPITELRPVRPRNPYAVSKVAAEALCYQWSQTSSFEIVSVRPFNHIGAGQNERFVVSSLAKQIVEIRKGVRPPILRVGDLSVTRDFTDVRDVVSAYMLLVEDGVNGETYNVCSGVERSIEALLNCMLNISGVSAEVYPDPELFRSAEQRRVCGSLNKINGQTGWLPKIPLERTLQDILSFWESVIQ